MKNCPGGKGQSGVVQRIIGQMPPHSVYVEPFVGSGRVFRAKRPALSTILIDANAAEVAKVGDAAGVKAIVGDALKVLPDLFQCLPPDAVVYCDPPYLHSTRTKRLLYGANEMTDEDHATLLAALLQARCRVLISGYPSALYSSQLHGWRCLEYDTMTRGGKRRECLWCNFPEPVELHDWRYAGFDFRQRFALKRFVRRWLDRIEAMPGRRRGYVLNELNEAISQRHGRRSGPLSDPVTPPLALAAALGTRDAVLCPDAPRRQDQDHVGTATGRACADAHAVGCAAGDAPATS